jgi:hypothetical protein
VLGTVPSYFVGTKMYMYEDMAGCQISYLRSLNIYSINIGSI